MRLAVCRAIPATAQSIKAHTVRHGSRRGFACSAARPFTILDVVTAPPMTFMNTIHACSIPWWAVIPSTAIAIRSLLFLSTFRRTHKRRHARVALIPLARAQLEGEALMRNILTQQGLVQKESAFKKQSLWDRTPFALIFRTNRLGRDVYPELFKRAYLAPAMRIAGWLAANEAIRMKLGMDTAVLAALYKAVFSSSSTAAGVAVSHFDATTQTEGLLWCSDLTMADPTGILQTTFLLLTLSSILAPPGRKVTRTWNEWRLGVSRQQWTVALIATVFYNFVYSMPAGLYLYWVSSAGVAKLQQLWLFTRDPVARPMEKCKIEPAVSVRRILGPGQRRS